MHALIHILEAQQAAANAEAPSFAPAGHVGDMFTIPTYDAEAAEDTTPVGFIAGIEFQHLNILAAVTARLPIGYPLAAMVTYDLVNDEPSPQESFLAGLGVRLAHPVSFPS